MSIYKCDICEKEFRYKSKYIEHKNRKTSCKNTTAKYNDPTAKYNDPTAKYNYCHLCKKSFSRIYYLNTHVCKGNILQCQNCLKVFSSVQSKNNHRKYVICKKEEDTSQIQERPIHQTFIQYNINDNKKILINYNSDTKCLETNDPHAPTQSLMCYNAFKIACTSTSNLLDKDKLNEIIKNILSSNLKNYDNLWTFLFRNIDNKSMHMFMLSRNNNETHAQVFQEGDLKSIHKNNLYKTLATYVSHYILLHIDFSTGASIVSSLSDDPDSKQSFFHVIKENSETFDYFRKWLN